MSGMLVALSGIDCSGKSTQIDLLERALSRMGRKPTVFWLRPGYSRELDALRAFVRRIRPQTLPKVNVDPEERARVFARPSVRRTWVNVAIFDMLLQYGLKIRRRLLTGRVVICDRYLIDALIDFRLRFPELRLSRRTQLLRTFCPKPDHSILLMLPEEEMLRRMEIKNEPFPDPPEVRDARYRAYCDLADTNVLVVDAARSIEAVHAEILNAVLTGESYANR